MCIYALRYRKSGLSLQLRGEPCAEEREYVRRHNELMRRIGRLDLITVDL